MKYIYKVYKTSASGFWGGKVDSEQLELSLNQFGEEGWEIIASFDTNQTYGETKDIVFILKKTVK